MGKGAGPSACREPLALSTAVNSSDDVYFDRRIASINKMTSLAHLRRQLKNAQSYPEHLACFYRLQELTSGQSTNTQQEFWRLNTRVFHDLLQRGHVDKQLEDAKSGLSVLADIEVLGQGWYSPIFEVADNAQPELVALSQQIQDAWEAEKCASIRYRELDTSYIGDIKAANIQEEVDELHKERQSKRQEHFALIGDRAKLREKLYGHFSEDGYTPGERVDLGDQLDQIRSQRAGEIETVFARRCEEHRYALQAVLEENYKDAKRRSEITQQDPNWTEQNLEDLSERLGESTQPHPIFLQSSLVQDHLLYIEKANQRTVQTGYEYHMDPLVFSLYDLKNQLKEEHNWSKGEAMTWMHQAGELLEAPIALNGKELAREDVYQHTKKYFPVLDTYDEAIREKVIKHISESKGGQIQTRQTWRDSGDAHYRAFAEVSAGQTEETLINKLCLAGAQVEDHQVEVPDYESRHNISPGKRFSLAQGDKSIHYVPHYSAGEKQVETYSHRATIDFSRPEVKDALKQVAKEERLNRAFSIQNTFMVGSYNPDGQWIEYCKNLPPGSGMAKLYEQASRGQAYAQEEMKDLKITVRPSNQEEMLKAGYREIDNDRWVNKAIYRSFKDECAQIDKWGKQPNITVSWDKQGGQGQEFDQTRFRSSVHAKIQHSRVPQQLQGLLRRAQLIPSDRKVEKHIKREHRGQGAPSSERGRLVLQGYTPKEAVDALQNLDACKGITPKVPMGWAYPDRKPIGRVSPVHAEYAEKPAPAMPDGNMVVHGMTGVQEQDTAMERFTRMVSAGGLRSISERRRAGINVTSLSPIGDIASGIDTGVACSVLDAPHHGHHLFFALKPDVIKRRDLWFSDRDFGACEDRYDKYNDYARSIGQARIHKPASHRARQKHLDHGCKSIGNELYLKHGVSLDEIDTVYVDGGDSFYSRVHKQVADWRAKGLFPENVRVLPFQNDPELANFASIPQRARQLAGK